MKDVHINGNAITNDDGTCTVEFYLDGSDEAISFSGLPDADTANNFLQFGEQLIRWTFKITGVEIGN